MRTLKILLVIGAVIFSGFSKDLKENKSGPAVPFKFEGAIILDPSVTVVCSPTGEGYPYITHSRTGWLRGNQSHGGKLIKDQSTWTIFNCDTDFSTMINTSYVEGVNTVANGDSYFYTCVMVTDLSNLPTIGVTLLVTVTGGSGIFEGATGNAVLSGVHAATDIPVSGWGSLTLSR